MHHKAVVWSNSLPPAVPDCSTVSRPTKQYATACISDAPFCYVGAFTVHVNVGFFYRSQLSDPAGLLLGSGLNTAALSALTDAAYADIKTRLHVPQNVR